MEFSLRIKGRMFGEVGTWLITYLAFNGLWCSHGLAKTRPYAGTVPSDWQEPILNKLSRGRRPDPACADNCLDLDVYKAGQVVGGMGWAVLPWCCISCTCIIEQYVNMPKFIFYWPNWAARSGRYAGNSKSRGWRLLLLHYHFIMSVTLAFKLTIIKYHQIVRVFIY